MVIEELVDRFRALSLERIGRVESLWNGLVQGVEVEDSVHQLLRDLHTLKGDSAVVGFPEVNRLCQKLEDLLSLAGELRYQVSDDFELVVTMAIQFLGMLLRKRTGGAMGGLDLAGFVRQVDDVLRESRTLPASSRTAAGGRGRDRTEPMVDRLSEPTRQRLAIAATTAFLEYLSARGSSSRTRLRSVWQTLRQELSRMQSVSLAPLLEHHASSGRELARGLHKRVDFEIELDDMWVDTRVAEAIDIAVLHLVRNAIDHGIESPAARLRARKGEAGRVRVHGRQADGAIEISVADDGAGIDLAALRQRGLERGLLDAARAQSASEHELLELVFQPGFSTRTEVTDVSGRGVGMDAVRSAVVRVGGSVRIDTRPGGSSVTLKVPAPARRVHAYQFLAPGGSVALAISARWTPSVESALGPDVVDPLHAIQLMGSSRQTRVGPSKPGPDLALRLRWGFLEVGLRTASEPLLVTAERICPTPDDHPLEVISVDDHETLLVRPEHIHDLTAALPTTG